MEVLEWSFYETKEDLARLMRELNANDARERALYPELERCCDNIPYTDVCDREKKLKKLKKLRESEERQRRAEVGCSRAEPTEEDEERENEDEDEEEGGGGGGRPAVERDEGNNNKAKEAGSKRDVRPPVSLEQVGSPHAARLTPARLRAECEN
jgi:hypothetical protein